MTRVQQRFFAFFVGLAVLAGTIWGTCGHSSPSYVNAYSLDGSIPDTSIVYRGDAGSFIPSHESLMAAAAACGGTGVGQLQDATVQCLAAYYGLSTPVGGTGVGLAQDATLQAILAFLQDGGGGTRLPDGGVGAMWYQADTGVATVGPCSPGQTLEWPNGIPVCTTIDAGSGFTPGGDLTGNSSAQYVKSLSGVDGGGGVVTVPIAGESINWTSGAVTITQNGSTVISIDQSGSDQITMGSGLSTSYAPAAIAFGANVTTPTISQLTSTTGNGQPLKIISQGPLNASTNVPGDIELETPSPISTGTPGAVDILGGSTAYIQMGQQSNAATYGAIWGPVARSSSNPAILTNGSSTYLNCTSEVLVTVSTNLMETFQSSNIMSYVALEEWASTVNSPQFTQAAAASTSSGSGSAGQTMIVSSQAGQAATGAGNNGGNGGVLEILSGAGGTSGSASAGSAGVLDLGAGGTGASGTGGINIYSGLTAFYSSSTELWTTAGGTSQIINVVSGVSSPLIGQAAKTSDAATQTLTIAAQNADQASASITNTTGGSILIQAGTGAINNTGGTWASGNITLEVNAPNSGGTEAYTVVNRGGTNYIWMGAQAPTPSVPAIYLVNSPTTSSGNDWNLSVGISNTATRLNGPTYLEFVIGGLTNVGLWSSNNLTLFNGSTQITAGWGNSLGIANGTGTFSAPTGGGALFEVSGELTHGGSGSIYYELAPPGSGTQNSQKGIWYNRSGFVEITGGAKTTCYTLPLIATGRVQHITADVTCTDTVVIGSSAGATVAGSFYNNGGTVTQISTTQTVDNEGFGSIPSLTISGTTIEVQVTPNAEENTDCQCFAGVNYD